MAQGSYLRSVVRNEFWSKKEYKLLEDGRDWGTFVEAETGRWPYAFKGKLSCGALGRETIYP